jgi:hypothetical protein
LRLLTVAVPCAAVDVPLELLVSRPVLKLWDTAPAPVVRLALCESDATEAELLYDGGAAPELWAIGPTFTVALTTPAADTFSWAPTA